jgi:hypothetical protein
LVLRVGLEIVHGWTISNNRSMHDRSIGTVDARSGGFAIQSSAGRFLFLFYFYLMLARSVWTRSISPGAPVTELYDYTVWSHSGGLTRVSS